MIEVIKKLVEEHKFFRRLSLVWCLIIVTYATIAVFSDLCSLTPSGAAAYATVAGLLSVVIGFYTHARSRDSKAE